MAPKHVGMHEAKTQFSKLVRAVEDGEEIVITRSGKPVARLVGPEPVAKRKLAASYGMFEGQMWLADETEEDRDEMARLFGIID